MNMMDFILSVLASFVANQIQREENNNSDLKQKDIKQKVNQYIENTIENTKEPEDVNNEREGRKFVSFDQNNIFTYIDLLDEPRLHILFESTPSTSYHLSTFVLECRKTDQWYVFERGRTAAEGTGGGWSNLKNTLETFQEKGIKFYLWVMEKESLDELEEGKKLWSEISNKKIPLLATDLSWFAGRIRDEINDKF